jgi:ABC-type antimicrobial peptide transport system permease subunit
VKYGKEEGWLEVYGIAPASMEQKGIEVASGRLLEAGDQNAIVVGGMIGDSFYDPNTGWVYNEDETYEEYRQRIYDKSLGMLNKKVTAEFRNYETQKSKKVTFQVVGVTPVDSPNNYYAYAPLSVMQNIQKVTLTKEQRKDKNRDIYNEVTIVTEDVKYTKEICQSLRDSGYNCYSIAESLEGVEDSMQTVQLVLGGIGSITLLVAAIGIINTMVMSIYERTREIAIMKVIGATFNDIRMMFLAEAGLIGLLGGIFGLIFSYTLSFLLNKFAVGFMGGIGAEGSAISVIPWWLAVFAIVFSILIGLLAGVYPANRAVKLSPIEAMRNN